MISLLDRPPCSMMDPATIKNGIAIIGKESVAEYILCAMTVKGTSPVTMSVTIAANPTQRAMGMPRIKSRANMPNSKPPTIFITYFQHSLQVSEKPHLQLQQSV